MDVAAVPSCSCIQIINIYTRNTRNDTDKTKGNQENNRPLRQCSPWARAWYHHAQEQYKRRTGTSSSVIKWASYLFLHVDLAFKTQNTKLTLARRRQARKQQQTSPPMLSLSSGIVSSCCCSSPAMIVCYGFRSANNKTLNARARAACSDVFLPQTLKPKT
jgi:hypothetical protein